MPTQSADRLAYVKAWIAKNHDKIIANQSRYREAHRPAVLARNRAYMANRRKDPKLRRSSYLRQRLRRHLLFTTTPNSDIHLLTTLFHDEFKAHIQALFKDGMSMDNYGSLWELDHVIPVSSFDCTIPSQAAACFHFSNIRPLLKSKNRRLGQGRENFVD